MTGYLDRSGSSVEARQRHNQHGQEEHQEEGGLSKREEQRRGRSSSRSSREDDDRSATELPEIPLDTHHSDGEGPQRYSEATTADDSERARVSYRLVRQTLKWYDGLLRVWHREVSVKVDAEHRRDHLALERTFLAYIRTSVALSMTGVVTAQLFRLQHTFSPNTNFGFFVVGIPLGACFILAAIIVVVIGAFRFWRQQKAMTRGKIWAGGWEVNTIMIGSILLIFATFALVVGITIDKDNVMT